MTADLPEWALELARGILDDINLNDASACPTIASSLASVAKAERERAAAIIKDEIVEIYEDSPDIDIECNNLCRRAVAAILSDGGRDG